jgi:peptidoglycan/xylan/chitin deacetylase (PgdA/CDA1 family)
MLAPWAGKRSQMPSPLHTIVSKASGRLPGNLAVRRNNAPICTFTFDDCPRNALENGGRMLEEHGLVGTYFVAGAYLDDPAGPAGRHSGMLTPRDLEALVKRGHELGCHTYSHKSARGTTVRELLADIEHNREVLLGASGAESLTSFSYPFGETNWTAKAEITKRFAAARGIRPGINGRVLDLAQLRAVHICAERFSEERIRALIQRTVKTRGWLIFYTHEVGDAPSEGSCTEQQFAQVLDMVIDSHVEILPMRSALGRMMHRG